MMVGPYLVSQLIGGVLGAGMAKVFWKYFVWFLQLLHTYSRNIQSDRVIFDYTFYR